MTEQIAGEDKIIDTSDLSVFDAELKQFKAPRAGRIPIPYVLFGRWRRNFNGTAEEVIYTTSCMQFRGPVPDPSKIDQYLAKGWQLLGFWFPTTADLPVKKDQTERGWIGMLRTSEDSDPYRLVRSHCKNRQHGSQKDYAHKVEVTSLNKELEQYRVKNGPDKATSGTKSQVASESGSKKES